jgi:myo-inositol 2-dehydrogenase / D-chiro-inositol 1-dehydrogenase|tara:strand:+ start:197 stop:1210 length:1014 start_codon:yes stop_codon:yes gene_type:complete
MGKNKINIALFGLGRIGQMHAENLINHPQFYLKYIFDIDKNLTEKLSKKYNCISIKNPNIAFRDKNIKSIFIATSTKTHLRFIEEGVKNKKVIFCEKPLDLDLKKINQSKKKLAKLNPKIQMGFNRRYDPAHNSLKEKLIKNKIGKLEKIIITSRDPAPPPLSYLKVSGGIFKDMMIHDFDLARYYAGSDEFESIFATGKYFSDKKYKKVKDLELATVVMKTKKGVQCIITNSRHCSFGYDQRIELFGSKGMMISDNQRDLETSIYSKNSTNNKSLFKTFFIERYSEAYRIQLDDLVKLCKKSIKPIATFEDGRKSLILAETAKKSLKTKKFETIKF